MEKIFFDLDVVDGYPPVAVESLWGEKVDDHKYRIKNLPFYIRDIALNDIVLVELVNDNLKFKELLSESGHGVINVILFDSDFKDEVIKNLKSMRLYWESIQGENYYSIDIPNVLIFNKIIKFLKNSSNFLDYQETVIPSK